MATSDAPLQVGRVVLTVNDLGKVEGFYRDIIGLQRLSGDASAVVLGVEGAPLVELRRDSAARLRPNEAGLFHTAFLLPDRQDLGSWLRFAAEGGMRLDGASDHLVSEALYLSDPDGNGIEVYRDRPRAEWQYEGNRIVMGGLPLDYQGILNELNENGGASNGALSNGSAWSGLEPETIIGHMHLHVNDLAAATDFYTRIIGFDLMMEWNGASFLAAGGYHHHLGVNTWAGVGAPPQPADAAGLRHYVVQLPEHSALDQLVQRLDANGVAHEPRDNGLFTRDPAQNGILFSTGENPD